MVELHSEHTLSWKSTSQLKDILCKLKLHTNGNRSELINRILQHMAPKNPRDPVKNTTIDIFYMIMDYLKSNEIAILYGLNKQYKTSIEKYANVRFSFQSIENSKYYAFNRHRLITKFKATSIYRLTYRQLDDIQCIRVQNSDYFNAPDIVLYYIGDILPFVIQKFGCIDNLIKYHDKRENAQKLKYNF